MRGRGRKATHEVSEEFCLAIDRVVLLGLCYTSSGLIQCLEYSQLISSRLFVPIREHFAVGERFAPSFKSRIVGT